jgi:uncharacterized membrane protein YkvA (DUF1232 family)
MGLAERWRGDAWRLRREVHALYLACRDPRVPWPAKVLAAGVVAYALSPIDLIPDFVPVLGYLDDLIVVPLGLLVVRRMIPAAVMAECRLRAEAAEGRRRPPGWIGAAIVVALWLVAAVGVALAARRVWWGH